MTTIEKETSRKQTYTGAMEANMTADDKGIESTVRAGHSGMRDKEGGIAGFRVTLLWCVCIPTQFHLHLSICKNYKVMG